MEDKFDRWADDLQEAEILDIVRERLGNHTVEEALWDFFIEEEKDREHFEGEVQMEQEREDRP